MRRTAGYTWTDYKTNIQIAMELKITPILDKLLEYKRKWMQQVNRIPRNRLPRVMKHYSPTGRRNHGRPLKRLLDTFIPERVNNWPNSRTDTWRWWCLTLTCAIDFITLVIFGEDYKLRSFLYSAVCLSICMYVCLPCAVFGWSFVLSQGWRPSATNISLKWAGVLLVF